jgi:hypothetical protein
LTIEGSSLINSRNNKVVSIRGINWFGFNVGMGMVDGLWAGGSAAATDFALITYQLRLLGYNAGAQGLLLESLVTTYRLRFAAADVRMLRHHTAGALSLV